MNSLFSLVKLKTPWYREFLMFTKGWTVSKELATWLSPLIMEDLSYLILLYHKWLPLLW